MRALVYTCVFGAYDQVFPPLVVEPGVDYLLVTDDPALQVPGWRTVVADVDPFQGLQAANRYYKMLGHREFSGYDASLYVDGNIRLLGPVSPLLSTFLASGAALGVYRHPVRFSVEEEVAACIRKGKVDRPEQLRAELAAYRADGFADDQGLIEATILLKNLEHPELDPAMALWWSLFQHYGSRDQVSLPYVQWKTHLPCYRIDRSFREPNPFFGIYPHFGAELVSRRFAYVSARAYDSVLYRVALRAWKLKWRLQRRLRRMGSAR